jgi:hypothetical protein
VVGVAHVVGLELAHRVEIRPLGEALAALLQLLEQAEQALVFLLCCLAAVNLIVLLALVSIAWVLERHRNVRVGEPHS